jgi:hypothetical protein
MGPGDTSAFTRVFDPLWAGTTKMWSSHQDNSSHHSIETIDLPRECADLPGRAATLTRINLLDGRRQESLANYAVRQCPTGTLS